MTQLLSFSDPIYEDIIRKNNYIYKTIRLKKEIDIIQNTNVQKKKVESFINNIEYMNGNTHFFKKYYYKIINTEDLYELKIKTQYLPTLDIYIANYGFNKKQLDILVNRMCKILDYIDYHGHITFYNIYTDYYSFYLSDIKFYDIFYKIETNQKSKDLNDLVKIIYQLVPQSLKNQTFFKKGLSKKGFQSTTELLKFYRMDIKEDFQIEKTNQYNTILFN